MLNGKIFIRSNLEKKVIGGWIFHDQEGFRRGKSKKSSRNPDFFSTFTFWWNWYSDNPNISVDLKLMIISASWWTSFHWELAVTLRATLVPVPRWASQELPSNIRSYCHAPRWSEGNRPTWSYHAEWDPGCVESDSLEENSGGDARIQWICPTFPRETGCLGNNPPDWKRLHRGSLAKTVLFCWEPIADGSQDPAGMDADRISASKGSSSCKSSPEWGKDKQEKGRDSRPDTSLSRAWTKFLHHPHEFS